MRGERPDPVKKRLWITLVVLLVLLAAVAAFIAAMGGNAVGYESPEYRVSERIGEVEIRDYESYLVAETRVDGALETAGKQGFRILAGYIFGGNQGKQRVAMTSPVSQTQGSKIAMTSPVTQSSDKDQFVIQFMMPSEYAREELPAPNDARVEFRQVPARRLAVIRYSGSWSEKNYARHLDELRQTLEGAGYVAVGEPIWARYDPPFKPWFLRRNEILTAFEAAGAA